MSEEVRRLIDEIKEMRKDMHWLLQARKGPEGRIYNESGCACGYFLEFGSEQWECPLHGTVKRTGAWKEPE